jgi:hypothetical protein
MPRPMMILAGERQPGRQVSPIREQNVALGVAPSAGPAPARPVRPALGRTGPDRLAAIRTKA